MEELSAEELQQLEERLYSEVHHTFPNTNTFPPHEENQTKNVDTEKNSSSSKFLSKRYWTNKSDETTLVNTPERQNKGTSKVQKRAQPQSSSISSPTITNNIYAAHNQNDKKQNNNRNRKVRNPFASSGKQFNTKGNNVQQNRQFQHNDRPFVERAEKLQRCREWKNKKQKAKNAHDKMLTNIKVIANIELDSDDDNDDEVVHVPIPPAPVFNIDDSDEEMALEEVTINKELNSRLGNRFVSPQTKNTAVPCAKENSIDNASRCNSPCSVMSHDDFIGQSDRHRLLDNTNIANDGDLLMLNSNTDSLLEPPTPPIGNNEKDVATLERKSDEDIECVGTFIKPKYSIGNSKKKDNGKQNYCVDETEFRALDVYESESDIVSDGVYTKGTGKPQFLNTSIRSLDNSSGEELDISQTPVKTKRLRKRRASATLRNSESNASETTNSESDNDGVEPTGIPFISRGPAVESHKSKKKRKHTISTGRMSDTEFVATLNSLAQGEQNDNSVDESESDEREKVPTARELAESALKSTTTFPAENQTEEEQPKTSAASKNLTNDEAVPLEIANDINNLFKKINEFDGKKTVEISDEEYADIVIGSPVTGDVSTLQNVEQDKRERDDENDGSAIKYFIGYTPANNKCFSDGFGWNEEMQRFYNDSWGGELFNEEYVWKTMPRHPSLWRILDSDRVPIVFGRSRGAKCMNCLTFGHSRSKCPEPLKRPKRCFMCGQSGHLEARCPDTRCLRCGNKTTVFTQSCKKCMFWNNRICPICKLRGHSLNDCPDKWRRYHSTTKPNVYPNAKVVYNKRRFCSFCGKPGHLSDECREAFCKTEYPIISTEIKSHEKSYDDVIISPYRTPGIACRLLYDPNLYPNFTLAEKSKRFQVYGRFLSAVGLRRLIGKSTNTIQRAITSTIVTGVGCSSVKTPEQVPEITEGKGNIKTTNKPQESKANNTSKTEQETSALTSSQQMPPPHKPVDQPMPIDTADSDSNYSFSDHFEMPSTSSSKKLTKSPPTQTPAKNLTPLPDFIPLGGGNRFQETPIVEEYIGVGDSPSSFGISSRFVESYSDDEHEMSVPADLNPVVDENKACEAKIYISDEHHKYFQTESGQTYLKKIMTDNKLTGQMNRTIVGYALFLNGLPNDQEKLQRELELKFKELNREKPSPQNEIQVPKNIVALKRSLQDGIKQLLNNLGNPTDIYKQMNELEKKATKSSLKTADRMRRTLNMIFIGQAGLNNGDNHFDTLLNGLHELTYNNFDTEQAPFEMRKKLSASWRMIFTNHNHKNYSTLMLAYLKLSQKMRNRLIGLNIDAQLLGNTVVNVTLTKEQKERMNEFTKHDQVQIKLEPIPITNANNIEEDAPLLLNVVVPGIKEIKQKQTNAPSNNTESNKTSVKTKIQNEDSNEQTKMKTIECKPQTENEKDFINNETQQTENTTNKEVSLRTTNESQSETIEKPLVETEKEPENTTLCYLDNIICQNLLKSIGIEKTLDTSCKMNASKIASEFWSRESQKLLLDLIDLAKSSKNLEHLNCIYKNAMEHKLSYNDYNCIVKLHNQVIKK